MVTIGDFDPYWRGQCYENFLEKTGNSQQDMENSEADGTGGFTCGFKSR